MIDLEDYEQLKNFCNYDDVGIPDDGVAYRKKNSGQIYCFMYVDVERGRGEPTLCKVKECKHYIYVNPNRVKLTTFPMFDSQRFNGTSMEDLDK